MAGPTPGYAADMADAIAAAGYTGIEISNNIIGGYQRDPAGLKALLASRNLEFVAYAFSVPSGFTVAAERDGDLRAAEAALDFAPGGVECRIRLPAAKNVLAP